KARYCGARLPALRRRCFATIAVRLRSLRSYRNSSDQAPRDASDALWRGLPVLRQEVQSGGAGGYAQGLAVRGESARPRHLFALHAGDRLRAIGDVVVRYSRAGDQRGRARQHAGRLARRLRRATQHNPRQTAFRDRSAIGRNRAAGRQSNWWLWVFHHGDSAVFVAEPSRAKKVVEDFLGDFRPDYWVSDRYGGQLGWANKENQVCLAHLIRDVQYAIDCGDDVFAPDLRHLLGRACRIGRRRERLSDATLKTYARRLEARLDQLMVRTPMHAAGVKLQ